MSRTITLSLAVGLFWLTVLAHAASLPDADEYRFHSVVPLGVDAAQLQSSGEVFFLAGAALSPEMEGWQRQRTGNKSIVVDANGKQVVCFPKEISFRVTASGRAHYLGVDPLPIATDLKLNEYLLKLGFRLKVFHGLEAQQITPDSVIMIGMPADVDYNERIFVMKFSLPEVPVGDRMMLEVLSPDGSRLSKFHLDVL